MELLVKNAQKVIPSLNRIDVKNVLNLVSSAKLRMFKIVLLV